MFIAALLTIAKLWYQLGAQKPMIAKRKYGTYIYNGILFINKEE
jgi:hypothetical protein